MHKSPYNTIDAAGKPFLFFPEQVQAGASDAPGAYRIPVGIAHLPPEGRRLLRKKRPEYPSLNVFPDHAPHDPGKLLWKPVRKLCQRLCGFAGKQIRRDPPVLTQPVHMGRNRPALLPADFLHNPGENLYVP